ncbi:hypothetical protein ACJJI4_17070 [Microbulbifer sp. TRSA002]|uniref:hypothetical protein n=1 Tax=Microbulbifer sp. TRSA002 TaxID=3243382 RepID=UPI00403A542C
MLATHQDAERRYGAIRAQVLNVAESMLRESFPALRLKTIDSEALKAVMAWDRHPGRRVNWDWAGSYPELSYRHPKRFECAIWHRGQLNGSSLGRPTYCGGSLRLDFIEATPEDKDIPVLDVVVVAMQTYADVLGAKELRIMHPINEAVKSYYASHGFTYVSRGDYLYLRI